LELGERATLSTVVGTVKAVTAHRLGRRCWQSGFYDHAVRRDEDLVRLTRYVIANPLRAGLVTRIGDYPHWDAIWL
jgi:putative transposase